MTTKATKKQQNNKDNHKDDRKENPNHPKKLLVIFFNVLFGIDANIATHHEFEWSPIWKKER